MLPKHQLRHSLEVIEEDNLCKNKQSRKELVKQRWAMWAMHVRWSLWRLLTCPRTLFSASTLWSPPCPRI